MPRFSKKVIGTVDAAGDDVNAYEAERAARIEENKRRMMALGIFDTANALADAANAERVAARNARADAALANGGYNRRIERPAVKRRSGRLSGEVPKDYSAGTNRDLWEPAYNEERYTLAHKEALGTSTKTWTLFVDGYDAKGNRIYDPVRGATCHQCRQKTVCKHTSSRVAASSGAVLRRLPLDEIRRARGRGERRGRRVEVPIVQGPLQLQLLQAAKGPAPDRHAVQARHQGRVCICGSLSCSEQHDWRRRLRRERRPRVSRARSQDPG